MERKMFINKKSKATPDHKVIPERFPRRADEQLPDIDILGQSFHIDWLARELRPWDKKSIPVSLAQMTLNNDEGAGKFRFLYDPVHRQIPPEPKIGLEYPKDILLLEIPGDPRILDPAGLAMEMGIDPAAYIKNFPVQLLLIAKIIPWESTRYSKSVHENKSFIAQHMRELTENTARSPKKSKRSGKEQKRKPKIETKFIDEELTQRRLADVLPHIDVDGRDFIVDWRLRELRAVDDPSDRISLKNLPMDADGLNYLCFYNTRLRQAVIVDIHMTELPKDVVVLTIPGELKLDPVAVAREYGLDDRELLPSFPLQRDLKVTVTPIGETEMVQLVKRNREKQERLYPSKTTVKKRGKRKGI